MLNVLNSIIENTMEDTLKHEVAEIIVDMLSDEATNEEVIGTIENITTYGCASGTVLALVYYSDTEAFFDRHAEEIFELIENLSEEGILDKNRLELSKNNLAWTAFELIAWEIRDELRAA